MDKITISGNGTLPPVLWVGARLQWPTPLFSTDQYLRRYWAAALASVGASAEHITAGIWETKMLAGVRP